MNKNFTIFCKLLLPCTGRGPINSVEPLLMWSFNTNSSATRSSTANNATVELSTIKQRLNPEKFSPQ